MDYSVFAYYVIHPLEDPEKERKEHDRFLRTLDSKGRIYISSEGVNAQLSLHNKDVEPFLEWLLSDQRYASADVKIHHWPEHPFHRLSVKVKKELVAMNQEVDFEKRGRYLTPKEWRFEMEKRDPNTLVIDVRNKYESDIGHFEGAVCPNLETFREFPSFVKELAERVDPEKTKVLMYCTGGIRCEVYSPLLKEAGFKEIFQLKGGVIGYGIEEGQSHWRGKLFVFDDRLVVPISKEEAEPIASCKFCQEKYDSYHNCANMDCNALFIACPNCIEKEEGCCQKGCLETGRVRKIEKSSSHPKPFRRLPFEEKRAFFRREL